MSAARIAVGGFQHETNTFAPLPTTWEDFETAGAWPGFTAGETLFAEFEGANIPLSGFVADARAAAPEWELTPLLWTGAEPSGIVAQAAFDRIAAEFTDRIAAAGPLDAVYLDLHGAMVTEDHMDGEAELLRRVREVVGPDMPVAVSLDLHGNMSREFFERASCVTIYRTYPHVDLAETGARCRRLLAELLARGRPFARAWRQLDYIIPITAQSTMHQPGGRLYGMLPGLEGGGVSSIDFVLGFPPADIRDNGPSVFAYGDDQAAVDRAADAMAAALADAEDEFRQPLTPAAQAVREAMEIGARAAREATETGARAAREATEIGAPAARPVVIADPQDNPGAGGVGDSTGVLRALIEAGATGAALSMLWDPETAAQAHAAGEGARIDVSLGGRFPEIGGAAVKARAVVERLGDGVVPFSGPMYGGSVAHLGPMARLSLNDGAIQVVVGSARCQNADQELFRALGVEPAEQRILAVKSAVHFLGDYAPIAEKVIFAEAPGANVCRMDALPFTRLRPGVRLGPNGPVVGG